MSKKWDKKNKKTVGLEPSPKVSSGTKTTRLFISVEEYANFLTEPQRAALREQRISRYPNLFDIRGYKEDVISRHPLVEMSNEARLYTSLFEESYKAKIRKVKKKKVTN